MKTKEPKRTGLTVSELLDPQKVREIEELAWKLGGHGHVQLKTKNNNQNDNNNEDE